MFVLCGYSPQLWRYGIAYFNNAGGVSEGGVEM